MHSTPTLPQYINYKGHRVAVYEEGQGAPVLFLHGWPTNAQLWQPQVAALKDHYRVLTLDWLGFGRSDKPTDYHYTFTQQEEVLDAVVQALLQPEEPITLIGHDIGGPPAILWASEQPELVRQLILLNTVLYPFSTPMDKQSHTLFKIPLLKQVLGSRFGLRQIMHQVSQSPAKQIDGHLRSILAAHEGLSSNLALRLILEPLEQGKKAELLSLAQVYQQLPVAKQLIVAQHDPLCGAHMERLRKENPTVPVVALENCKHYVAVDAAAELSRVLVGMLA